MKTFKTLTHHAAGKTPGRRRDSMRWPVATLAALALISIGAMETHVLMLRQGKDLVPAILEAAAFVLIAAIPIGYVVYRYWFAEHIFMKPLKGWNAGVDDYEDWFYNHRFNWLIQSRHHDDGLGVFGARYSDYGDFNLRDDD